jgi:uncharacterized protein HemY
MTATPTIAMPVAAKAAQGRGDRKQIELRQRRCG